ncbi:hypothetical protein PVK06_003130 [Gossypium arboreum]|uniref:Uncharacterized protein n=1 Tax=Gossypium arboreum TaxID=29729 RepID=A0ABR0R6I9_GOSAR|nr:hypothetical protein PVK06_003130 [Gossypium arboreum]
MAVTDSTESASVDGGCTLFTGEKVIYSFPRHDLVKLDEGTFIQWQQQVQLILRGYGLIGFLDVALPPPARFIQSPDGSLTPNPSVLVFTQQDQFLAS